MPARPQPGRAFAARWCRLVLGLSLLLTAAACSTTPGNIGVGLPGVDPTTGAYLVDTLTLKTSTVLRDSVITSTSPYMLVGRYIDPQLGTITATSYSTLNLGSSFIADRTFVADSVVLVLKPDTYRYGDTTKTQTLVEVRELSSFIPVTQYGFASPRITPMGTHINPTLLNDNLAAATRRAQPKLNTLRIKLSLASFGQKLMNAAKTGQLTTQDQFDVVCPGLALMPGTSDAAALVRLDANSTDQAVTLYYHDPTDPSTALSRSFSLNRRHFYQAEATNRPVPLSSANLPPSGKVDAAATGEQTYIEGLLGLQTKIEIPYLFDLRNYGQRFIITSAMMTAQVPSNTLGPNLAPPASLTLSTTNAGNQLGTTFLSGINYSANISSIDGIDRAGYTWSVQTYIENVLNNNVPNSGMLLNTATPTLPSRVVLGSARNNANKLQLRLYLIRND